MNYWKQASEENGMVLPTNQKSQWIFEKFAARTPTNFLALGLIQPGSTNSAVTATRLASLQAAMPREGVWFSGWELWGTAIFSSVKKNMWKLLIPMLGLVFLSLRL